MANYPLRVITPRLRTNVLANAQHIASAVHAAAVITSEESRQETRN